MWSFVNSLPNTTSPVPCSLSVVLKQRKLDQNGHFEGSYYGTNLDVNTCFRSNTTLKAYLLLYKSRRKAIRIIGLF